MNVTARTDYAIRALAELSTTEAGVASTKTIATAQRIPLKFLEAILHSLKREGLLDSVRGASGGYRLHVPADSITLADVIRAVDGPLASVHGHAPEDVEYLGSSAALRDVWVAVRASLRAVLETTTIADVAGGQLPASITGMIADDAAWVRR